MNIRAKIFLFIFPLAIAPLLIIGAFTYRSLERAFEEQSYLDDQQNCNAAAAEIERLLSDCNDAVIMLQSLANRRLAASPHPDVRAIFSSDNTAVASITSMVAARYSPFTRIRFLTPSGDDVFAVSRIGERFTPKAVAHDERFFQTISLDGQFPPDKTGDGSGSMTLFSYRLLRLVQLLGFIRLELDVKMFDELLNNLARTTDGRFILFDGSGRIIADDGMTHRGVSAADSLALERSVESLRKNAAPEFHHHRETIGARQYSFNSRPVKEFIAYHLPVPEERWYIGLVRAETPALAAFRESKTFFIVILVLCVALAIGGTVFISNRFTKPISQLTAAAKSIAKGRLDTRAVIASRDEMGQLSHAFNSMAADIEALMHERAVNETLVTIGRTSAALAHDLKNPIEGLKLLTRELAKQLPPDGITREIASTIEHAAERLSTLVRDTLDFTRLRTPMFERADLRSIIEEVIRDFDFHLVRIETRIGDGIPAIDIDSAQIRRMLSNLLKNAYEACLERSSADQKRVSVVARRKDEAIEITIADTGIGMTGDVAAKIFEPFFTTKASGHGLGLAFVRQIIANHRGALDVRSAPNEGTTFCITFPLTQKG